MSHQPQLEFYKKRQFGEKLNATFTFIRENAWPYLKVQFMIAGPILLIANILVNQFAFSMFDFDGDISANFFIDMFQMYGLLLLIGLVGTTIMPAVTYGYMTAYKSLAPTDISVANVTKGFASRFFNILGLNIITYIVTGIAMLFLILPGIYVAIVLSLGAAIIVFENSNPIDAFGRAFTLIKGKWWSTFGLLVVISIIGYIINFFFGLPRSIVLGIELFTSLDATGGIEGVEMENSTDQVLNVVFSVFETFGSILSYSLIYMALAFQYFNLVERAESRGLMTKIEQMDDAGEEESNEQY